MDDIWGPAIEEAVARDTMLRASELDVHMLVRQINGKKTWRVIGCYFPDGFALEICHLVDENNYDWTCLFDPKGPMNERKWILLGYAEHQESELK